MSFSDQIHTDLYLWIALVVLLLPLVSFVFLYFFGRYLPGKGDYFSSAVIGVCCALSLVLFFTIFNKSPRTYFIPWITLPLLNEVKVITVSIMLNSATVIMMVVVTLISFLVHLYSIGYMEGKRNYLRYFPYLALFTFSMLGIVLSDNLLITFMFWELVGFASFLLIGFWFEKESAAKAAKNAFIYNRVADIGFITALLALYAYTGTFELSALAGKISLTDSTPWFVLLAGGGLFLGSMGKSAQFPFQPWLAGAMEGPTPVSALLHAATMVAAGVYLLFKVQFLLSPEILTFIAFTGAITALMGAYAAITQNDIKKVLAFSTISQLGYMMVGIGSGSFDAAFFHLVTHAFFKACLFLCAGAVIHSMHKISHHLFDRQQYMEFNTLDMRLMGGFRKKMPVTFIAYTIAALSLIGIPLFSGFLSKDAILINSYHWAASGGSSLHFLVPFAAFITVFITAFYMGRQLFMVFFHKFRLGQIHETSEVIFEHLKENGKVFTIPVITLSFFSLWFIFSINPFSPEDGWFYSAFAKGASQHEPLIPVISVLLGTAGLFAAWSVYGKKPVATGTGKLTESFWFRLSYRNFYLQKVNQNLFVNSVLLVSQKLHDFDQKVLDRSVETVAVIHVIIAHIIAWFDKYIVDGIVTLTTWIAGFIGKQTRSLQVGKIQSYLFFLMLFLLSFLLFIII